MGIFSYDSKFNRVMTQLWNIVLLSLLWAVSSLPVITAGTSCIAVYTVLLKVTMDGDEDVSVFSTYWKAWKRNLKHGVLLTLMGGGLLYSAWLSWQLFEKTEGNPMGFLLAAIALVLVVALHGLYALPLEARYENTLRGTLHNARWIAARYAKQTAALVLVLAVEFGVFFLLNSTLVLLGTLFGPVCFMFTVSTVAGALFQRIEHPEPDEDD